MDLFCIYENPLDFPGEFVVRRWIEIGGPSMTTRASSKRGSERMAKVTYLLQNVTAGYVGNYPLFWKEGGFGYTPNIDEAQRFTPEEAADVVRGSRGSHKWKRWNVAAVLKAAVRVVDIQMLRAAAK